MPDVLNRDDLLGKDLFFLLDLTYAGRTYRMSSQQLVLLKDDGSALQYHPGISGLFFDDEIDLFSSSPKLISIPISIVLPDTDIAELVSNGYDLTTATGSLSLWIHGTTYESRRVLFVGSVKEPSYGAVDEPVSFSLEQNPFEDRSLLIDPKANVNDLSQGNLDIGGTGEKISHGETYPIIFGQPSSSTGFTTPALLTDVIGGDTPDTLHLLVAGHRIVNGAINIALLDSNTFLDTSAPSFNPTTATVTDDEGRITTEVTISLDMVDLAGRKLYANWDDTAYGVSNTDGSPMRGAGDIIEYMLKRSTLDVDFGRLGSAKQLLNEYLLDFYVDEAVSYWDFIKSNLLPILPVSVDVGPKGLYLVPWNFEPTSQDFVADIDVQVTGAERSSAVQYEEPKSLMNDITLEYELALPARKYLSQANAHGDPAKAGAITGGSFLNKPCQLSHNRYGSQKKVIQTNVVFDAGTASAIATWMTYANSLRSRTVSYDFDKSWSWLKAGDLVKLTDSELSFTDLRCFVQSVSHDEGPIITVLFKCFDSMQ